MTLFLESGARIDSSISLLSCWPDGSIMWACFMFCALPKAEATTPVFLGCVDGGTGSLPSLQWEESDSAYLLESCNSKFILSKTRLEPFQRIARGRESFEFDTGFEFVSDTNETLNVEVESSTLLAHQAHLEVTTLGTISTPAGQLACQFELHRMLVPELDTLIYRLTLRNPRPALHPNGQWDLGDPNSICFHSIDMRIALGPAIKDRYFRLAPDKPWESVTAENLDVYQESSGGDCWDSPNHVNHDNRVPMKLRGFRLTHGQRVSEGKRAIPSISVKLEQRTFLTLHTRRFWQTFPRSTGFDKGNLILGLFPGMFPDHLEIQPGESHSTEFAISLSEEPTTLSWLDMPTQIVLSIDWLQKTSSIFVHGPLAANDPIQNLVRQEGIQGAHNFFHKREEIDEYGWRNFGDVYADHEAANREDSGIFVSHYNNQYDLLFGMLYQYINSNETAWLELSHDLARHIVDIDIYHTSHDRAEYCNGLFWHTDHYAPAATASHRTYSRRQPGSIYHNQAGGGGPGGQHCYTTGLALYYLLTGFEPARRAVVDLTNWITCIYEGKGTLAELLLAVRNRNRDGYKNVFSGRYPLDRGTGNYVIALLDGLIVTSDPAYLTRAGNVILNTVTAEDDISLRNLLDVEKSWFYTVFLQAVVRYLLVKQAFGQFDEHFYHARDSLLHYARWMAKHETPYLDKPEILEFPNSTWAAQDIRKAYVLYYAACYSRLDAPRLLARARYFHNYVTSSLIRENTNSYTRILSILMQNPIPPEAIASSLPDSATIDNPFKRKLKSNYRFTRKIGETLSTTSLKKEADWLARRQVRIPGLTHGKPDYK